MKFVSRAVLVIAASLALVTALFGTPAQAAAPPSTASGLHLQITPVPAGVSPASLNPGCGRGDPSMTFLVHTTMGASFYCWWGHGSGTIELWNVEMWSGLGTNGGNFTYGSYGSWCNQTWWFNGGDEDEALLDAHVCQLTLY